MIRLSRTVAVVGSALTIAVAFGCGAAGGIATRAVSPCGTATAPTWSPDGTQIAWFGYRWPLPPHRHAVGSWNILRAFCASDADGKHLHQLAHTVCSEHCSNNLGDPPGQLNWVRPSLLVYGSDGVHAVSVGQKPELLARKGPDPYALDARGDRVATSDFASACTSCRGPVRIFSVPSGAVVGVVGGMKLENSEPSLSPDGTQVVFTRTPPRTPDSRQSGPPRPTVATCSGWSGRATTRSGRPPAIGSPTSPPPGRLGGRGGSWCHRAVRARRSCATAPEPSSAGPRTAAGSPSRTRRGSSPSSTSRRERCGGC